MAKDFQSNSRFIERFYSCRSQLLRYVSRRINSSDDSEDIVQEIYLRLLEYPDAIQEEKIYSLAFSMVAHMVADYLRRKYVRSRVHANMMETAVMSTDETEQTVIGRDLERLEKRSLEQMPLQRRLIYAMRMHEEKTSGEIARELGISVRTAENHYYVGIRQMRTCFLQAI